MDLGLNREVFNSVARDTDDCTVYEIRASDSEQYKMQVIKLV